MFRHIDWDITSHTDIITFDNIKDKNNLVSLCISDAVGGQITTAANDIVKAYWDVFAPAGIFRTILGYEFKIDTGTAPSVCCRLPNYGHYEGEIIMTHIKTLLDNKWIRECPTGVFGAPIVLVPKPHQEDVVDIKDFFCVCGSVIGH